MKIRNKKIPEKTLSDGSALILAVVLTSLLAIVGVLFVMVSRVEKMTTSAISDNKDLNLAVETAIATISDELVLDTPGVRPGEEYYDYPDDKNAWLASLEPFPHPWNPRDYWWQHISDVYERWGPQRPGRRAEITSGYQDPAEMREGLPADADGDGVSDSAWIELPGITSSKGRPIYAAIRVIDNGAMFNVNTGFKFDPTAMDSRSIDGSSPMQINLMALSWRDGSTVYDPCSEGDLLTARSNEDPILAWDLDRYERMVAWRTADPCQLYTPFDISDELEMRNRFVLNHTAIDTRLEELGTAHWRSWQFRSYTSSTPFTEMDEWFISANAAGGLDPNYCYRHLATTYNMDRIIRPDGGKMVNINTADVNSLYEAIRAGLWDAGVPAPNSMAAQMAVNLVDYRDNDNDVNTIAVDGTVYYGFERPCIYISEVAYARDASGNEAFAVELYKPYDTNRPSGWQLVADGDPCAIVWSGTSQFHVIKSADPGGLLFVGLTEPNGPHPHDGAAGVNPDVILSWAAADSAGSSYDIYVGTDFSDVNDAVTSSSEYRGNQPRDSNSYDPVPDLEDFTTYYWRIDEVGGPSIPTVKVWSFTTGDADSTYRKPTAQIVPGWSGFSSASIIELERPLPDGITYVVVDSMQVPPAFIGGAGTRSFQRDISPHKCIRRLWGDANEPNLGESNSYVSSDAAMIQAHPHLDTDVYENKGFKNTGEIGILFHKGAYYRRGEDPNLLERIGYSAAADTEDEVRIDFTQPLFQRIFNYLTVFDPTVDRIDNNGDGYGIGPDLDPNELKIPGRININTAPWYVIAQLPWVSQRQDGYDGGALAQAIVAYRDRTGIYNGRAGEPGFRSIGELMQAGEMLSLGSDGLDNLNSGIPRGPDLTDDTARDDFEERDLIFARISNLVTVRSDVFTAYILVRIGTAGPQKRVVAILDRSDVYPTGVVGGVIGKVKVRALHPVADPR